MRLCLRAMGQVRPAPPGATLVIAPHPDDEVLACGGLIGLLRQSGQRVGIVYLSSGENSHVNCCAILPAEVALRREQLAIEAAAELGVPEQNLYFLRLPDRGIPMPSCLQDVEVPGCDLVGNAPSFQFAPTVGQLAEIITAFGAEHVYCPHTMDRHRDHHSAALITLAAIERTGLNCAVHSYLVWGFFKLPLGAIRRLRRAKPWILGISGVLATKKAAMSRYFDSCAPCGLPYVGRLPEKFVEFFANRSECFFDRP
jgi:LmbE family N-acetylglucosaminyl deacetylase